MIGYIERKFASKLTMTDKEGLKAIIETLEEEALKKYFLNKLETILPNKEEKIVSNLVPVPAPIKPIVQEEKPYLNMDNDKNHDVLNLLSIDKLESNKYKDNADKNNLDGGGRKLQVYYQGYLDRTPMFFRSNGNSLDLLDFYRGKSVFIVSNGPSFRNVDWNKLKQPGIITYGLNNGAGFFRPNLWTCVDNPIKFLDNIWLDPVIMKIVPNGLFEKYIWDFRKKQVSPMKVKDCPNVVGFRRNEIFNKDTWMTEETINWGNHGKLGGSRSVNIAMLRIAFLLGFKKIYLLGFDFNFDNNDPYFFKEIRKSEKHQNAVFAKKNDYYFTELRPEFEKFGVEIFNCTENSKLTVFPQKKLEDALKENVVELYPNIEGYDFAVCPKYTDRN